MSRQYFMSLFHSILLACGGGTSCCHLCFAVALILGMNIKCDAFFINIRFFSWHIKIYSIVRKTRGANASQLTALFIFSAPLHYSWTPARYVCCHFDLYSTWLQSIWHVERRHGHGATLPLCCFM